MVCMAVVASERLRGDLSRLAHSGADVADFSRGAARLLAREVGFDGFCMLTMDPATLLPTGEVVENGLPDAVTPRMAEIEIQGGDVNAFSAIDRSERQVATLSETTNGDLDRSLRHRELRRPAGFGDELRAVIAGDGATWGGFTLLRGSDRDHFTPDDAAVVASVSPSLADGLRRAMLLTALPGQEVDDPGSAGLVLVAPDNSVTQADVAAEMWLDELREGAGGQSLPPVVAAVAGRARRIVGRQVEDGAGASARMRTSSGRWVFIRGSTLGDDADAPTAVMIEPARPHELAPLIADAYGLSDRERAVTQLVARGLPTNAIAESLYLSPWTVQDHLKSIFEKVGVSTRGELTARVFFDHYAPRLTNGTRAGSDG